MGEKQEFDSGTDDDECTFEFKQILKERKREKK